MLSRDPILTKSSQMAILSFSGRGLVQSVRNLQELEERKSEEAIANLEVPQVSLGFTEFWSWIHKSDYSERDTVHPRTRPKVRTIKSLVAKTRLIEAANLKLGCEGGTWHGEELPQIPTGHQLRVFEIADKFIKPVIKIYFSSVFDILK